MLNEKEITFEGGMVGENVAVYLELIVFCLFCLHFLGGSLFLDESATYLGPPLHYGLHAQQTDFVAALDGCAVDQEVVFHYVEFIVGKRFLSLSEDQSIAHFRTAVIFELLDGCLESLSLFLLVFCQSDQGG